MDIFHKTTHVSEILEESDHHAVIIYIHSSNCASSSHVYVDLESRIMDKKLKAPVYLVIVQTEPELAKAIEEYFQLKHESPQIIIVKNREVIYEDHHDKINPDKFILH